MVYDEAIWCEASFYARMMVDFGAFCFGKIKWKGASRVVILCMAYHDKDFLFWKQALFGKYFSLKSYLFYF